MSEITVLFLYIIAGVSLAASRWPSLAKRQSVLALTGAATVILGLGTHLALLWTGLHLDTGLTLSLANTLSFVGLLLALIALFGAIEPTLRGLSGGLLLLAAIAVVFTHDIADPSMVEPLSWQLQAHVLISLLAYGLLTVGAIVAVYALVQDGRLRSGRLSPVNHLFAPLVTTERLLFSVTAMGFSTLLLAVVSGLAFVDNLFAQHLAHKTVLSLLALLLFGVLLAGRQFAGWRGRQAVYLYLAGFALLCLAYYGTRLVLENVLGRSWS